MVFDYDAVQAEGILLIMVWVNGCVLPLFDGSSRRE